MERCTYLPFLPLQHPLLYYRHYRHILLHLHRLRHLRLFLHYLVYLAIYFILLLQSCYAHAFSYGVFFFSG
jgi:hypothetical protein